MGGFGELWTLLVMGLTLGLPQATGSFSISMANRDHLEFQNQLRLSASRNEVVSAVIKLNRSKNGLEHCVILTGRDSRFNYHFYKMEHYEVRFDQRSYLTSKAGSYWDPLVETDQICAGDLVWLDLKIPPGRSPGRYQLPFGIELKVWKMTMPTQPSMPLYIHLNTHEVFRAHHLSENQLSEAQASPLNEYIRLYRDHRIEPYGHNPYFYPRLNFYENSIRVADLNLKSLSQAGISFEQIVLQGALAPPILFTPDFELPPSQILLQAIDRAIVKGSLPPGSMAYVWDEGEHDPKLTLQSLSRAKWIKENAPHLRVMLTRVPTAEFKPFVDLFVAVQNEFQSGWSRPFGLYVSCQSQGSCQNGNRGRPSGPPMFVIDAPIVSGRAFFWINDRLGAQVGLYYNATEKLSTAWTDQYFAGGNGDGTLIYPDRTRQKPDPSIRLKMLRQGSYDVEYLRWAREQGVSIATPVRDQNHWSQSWDDYQRAREDLGERLNQLVKK